MFCNKEILIKPYYLRISNSSPFRNALNQHLEKVRNQSISLLKEKLNLNDDFVCVYLDLFFLTTTLFNRNYNKEKYDDEKFPLEIKHKFFECNNTDHPTFKELIKSLITVCDDCLKFYSQHSKSLSGMLLFGYWPSRILDFFRYDLFEFLRLFIPHLDSNCCWNIDDHTVIRFNPAFIQIIIQFILYDFPIYEDYPIYKNDEVSVKDDEKPNYQKLYDDVIKLNEEINQVSTRKKRKLVINLNT